MIKRYVYQFQVIDAFGLDYNFLQALTAGTLYSVYGGNAIPPDVEIEAIFPNTALVPGTYIAILREPRGNG